MEETIYGRHHTTVGQKAKKRLNFSSNRESEMPKASFRRIADQEVITAEYS